MHIKSFHTKMLSTISKSEKNLMKYQLDNKEKREIREINRWLYENKSWEPLNLSNLDLREIPPELFKLKYLKELHLNYNSLESLPYEISKLSYLEVLSLIGNSIIQLPDEINKLINIQSIQLDENELENLPESIGELKELRRFNVSNNLLSELPKSIGQLTNLSRLFVNKNKLTILPKEIGNLKKLRWLNLSNNQLNELPKEIKNLKNLQALELNNNPKLNIPLEIIRKINEPQTILNYYFENVYKLKGNDVRPLKEVKVLIVGQGRVGKTSVVKYLIENIKCNPKEPTTHGIIRNKWKINVIEEKTNLKQNVQLNIWDFGGQDIQHQTHQFFLNQRSLYLLVLDAGRDEAGSKLDYWLKKIETVGKDAPILVAVNKSEQCLLPLAYTELKEKFNIKGFFNISCETGQEMEELRRVIKNEIGKIENVFEPIRKEWFAVKEVLENLEEDYISREEYRKICNKKGVTDKTSQDTLLILLHELGVMLNFKEHETEVLNPEWVTRGVYQMVTSLDVQTNKGILTPELFKSEIAKLQEQLVSDHKEYLRYPPEKYSFITDLMKNFELAYQIDDTEDYFVPSLLPKDSPYVGEWNEKQCAGFRYNYENGLLHETIMSRFIVKMNKYILDKTQWLTGVLLQNEHGNKALVKADLSNGYLMILIDGNQNTRREFLGIIRDKFRDIHKDNRPIEEVPLVENSNVFVSYDHLLELERRGRENGDVTVNKIFYEFNVKDLLNGISASNERVLNRWSQETDEWEEVYHKQKKQNKEITHQRNKEINDVFGEYIEQENTEIVKETSVAVEKPQPSLFKTIATFVGTFIVILSSIGLYDYLQKQGYLSEKGFYFALVFTVVLIVVLATFALAAMGIIPADKIPDILKPALGLIGNNTTSNQEDENKKQIT